MLVNKKNVHVSFVNGKPTVVKPNMRTVWAPDVTKTHPWLFDATEDGFYVPRYVDAAHSSKSFRKQGSGFQPLYDMTDGTVAKLREATCICVEKPKPFGYYRKFCAHDRAFWSICNMCRRDKDEAAANFQKLMQGKL